MTTSATIPSSARREMQGIPKDYEGKLEEIDDRHDRMDDPDDDNDA